MRFEPDSSGEYKGYVFTAQQFLTSEDEARITDEIVDKGMELMQRSVSNSPNTVASKLVIALIIAYFIAFIVSAMIKPVICVALFGSIFLLLGIYMFFKKEDIQIYQPDSLAISQRANGLLVAAIGGSVTGGAVASFYVGVDKAAVTGGAVLFLIVAVFMLITALKDLLSGTSAFGESTEAECIGYARSFVRSGKSNRRSMTYAYVFKYYVDGEELMAIDRRARYDSSPQLSPGSVADITVSRRDKYEVSYNEFSKGLLGETILKLVFALGFLGASLCMFYFGADIQPEVRSKAVYTTDGRREFDDGYVNELLGISSDKWEISEYTVMDKYLDDDGVWIIELSNGTKSTAPSDKVAESYYVGLDFYEVFDSTTGRALTMFKASEWSYTGEKTVTDHTLSSRK